MHWRIGGPSIFLGIEFFFHQRSDIACSDVCIRYYPVLFQCAFSPQWLCADLHHHQQQQQQQRGEKGEWRFNIFSFFFLFFIFLFFCINPPLPSRRRAFPAQISFNNITLWNSLAPEHRWNHASSADLDWEISSTNLITERLLLSHSCQCLFVLLFCFFVFKGKNTCHHF